MAVKKQILNKAPSKVKINPKKTVKTQKAVSVAKLPKKSVVKTKDSLRVGKTKTQSKESLKGVKTKKRISVSKKAAAPKENFDSSLSLPTNMSQRAVEKSIVFKREFDHYFRDPAYKIAYVTGLCFLLVGSSLMASQAMTPSISHLMSGEVISPSLNLPMVEVPVASIDILDIDNVPGHLVDPYQLTFLVTNESTFKVHLRRESDNSFFGVNHEQIAGDKYKINIVPGLYSPGDYRVRITAINLDQKTSVKEQTNIFHIGPIETGTGTDENTDVILADDDESANDTVSIDNTKITDESVSTVERVEKIDTPVAPKEVIFELKKPIRDILEGGVKMIVTIPDNYSRTDLYARQINSLESLHIGKAESLLGKWVFNFNTKNLPNGKYEFFAVSKHDGKQVETKSLTLTVFNPPLKVEPAPIQQVDNFGRDVGNFGSSDSKESDDSNETKPLPIVEKNEVESETERLLGDNKTELNDLQRRLAVALQSGDEMLIEVARQAIQDRKKEIVYGALNDSELSEISDDIDKEIDKWIADVEDRIGTFERIRKERSEGKTSIDTDGDGISDYDEQNLYGTDPASADTDNDGFTDGIEIMRGYNPLDEAPEAVIEFESPRNSIGLAREDSLRVESVSPVVTQQSQEIKPFVGSIISGVGLPNSFVTIFIYSTPTVVSVRTDVDGSFEYTFDKELEDGHHDVYVAVTDNAGKIIAQSNPFSFIKKAEAFTPIDAAEAEVVTSDPIAESTKNTYSTVVGIGILALGLILLMLGISLRSKNEEGEVALTEADDSDDNPTIRIIEKPVSKIQSKTDS